MSDDDLYDAHLARSFVPVATQSMSDHPSASPTSTVMWSSSGGSPINKFTTEGCFTCAYPNEAADSLGQRHNQVTIDNYFKHLIMYEEDGCFAKHLWF